MSETNPTKPIPRRRRRWLRFSLGTLFLGLTALCVALAVWVHRAETQRQAVAVIEQAGGEVWYDDGIAPMWLRDLIGWDFFVQVQIVDLNGDAATDASVMAAGQITSLKHLNISDDQQRLVLGDHLGFGKKIPVKISPAGFRTLAGQKRIETLLLLTNQLTDDDLQWVATMHGLRTLAVRSENVSDNGVAHLDHLGQLTQMDLEGNTALTDACVPALAKITQLRQLDLSYTGVSDEGVQSLQTALPKCSIIYMHWPYGP